MNILIIFFIILFIISAIAISNASNNAKQGDLIPIKFKYIDGISKLPEGSIVKISSNEKEINIDGKYLIPKEKIISKNITSSNMLTEKQKSIIQRSLVGFALGGGLGAIVGGISGVGTKQKEEVVHFLTINYRDENDIEQEAMFSLLETQCLMYVNMFVNS